MKFYKLGLAIFVSMLWVNTSHAAGSTINEDFALVHSMCVDLESLAQKKDKDSFIGLIDSALKLSEAQRRDNSMAIDRFRPKLRAAKKSVKEGDFDKAVSLLKEARELMKPASATWDGGS